MVSAAATRKTAGKAAKKTVTSGSAAKAAKPAAGKSDSPRKAGAPASTAQKKSEKETALNPKLKPDQSEKQKEKQKKEKMVRDSFAMPESEYKVLGEVKRACLKDGIAIKKSELLRIGVELIRQMKVDDLKKVLSALPPMKAGRPKKSK